MVKSSVYVANRVADVAAVEAWLGRDLDSIQLHGGAANWADWQSSLDWLSGLFKDVGTDIMWSVPLIPWGANLKDAAAGKYHQNYVALAAQFVADWPKDDQIYIRLGWEFNGTGWNAWSATGQEAQYAQAFRNFVTAFRSVSDKFVFEWTPNMGEVGGNPERAYPGNGYVDVIGMDFYYDTRWDPADPVAAWNYFVSRPYGLQWHQDFAKVHGKPSAYAEWGVNSNDAAPFIKLAEAWFDQHDVLYQSYWESNAAFQGSLRDGQYGAAAAAFKAAFGADAYTGAVVLPPKTSTIPPAQPAPAKEDVSGQTDAYRAPIKDAEGRGDTTITSTDHTLDAITRNLGLTGSARQGTGNPLDNKIVGTSGNDILKGLAGDDTLMGGGGNDTLEGGWGNDVLIGGAGADRMIGGDGNDIYVVEQAGDAIVEWYNAGKGGSDTAYASVDYTLGDNIENLVLIGTAPISGTGNRANNELMGNAGLNHLNGGAGNDRLDGGGGADVLTGGSGADQFLLQAGQAQGDLITDFARGDRLVFEGYGAGARAILSGSTLTVIHTGGSETLTVLGSGFSLSAVSFTSLTQSAIEALAASVTAILAA